VFLAVVEMNLLKKRKCSFQGREELCICQRDLYVDLDLLGGEESFKIFKKVFVYGLLFLNFYFGVYVITNNVLV
jgi:hypothetical protein